MTPDAAPPSDPVAVGADKRYYPVLDGMRGLAAMAVVVLHLSTLYGLGYRPLYGHLAVDMFFVLSGVVIAGTYEGKLLASLSFGTFLSRRVVRLYPMTVLGVLAGAVALAAAMLSGQDAPKAGGVVLSVLSSALLIPSPFLLAFRPWAFPGNSPLWSLSAEIVVNLIYARTVRLLRTGLLAGLALLGAVALTWIALTHRGLDVGFAWSDYPLGLTRAAASFLTGVLIHRVFGRAPVGSVWAHLAPAPLLAVLFWPLDLGGVFEAAAVILIFPACLVLAMRAPPAPRLDRIWLKLGAYSYPVYTLHYPIILICAHGLRGLQHRPAAQLLAVAATAGVVVVCAGLALRFYDMPARAALARLLGLGASYLGGGAWPWRSQNQAPAAIASQRAMFRPRADRRAQ